MKINCPDLKIEAELTNFLQSEITQILMVHRESNIRLLHPSARIGRTPVNVIPDISKNNGNRNLILALFQELRPEKRGLTHFVSYRMNKPLLLELANELLLQKDVAPVVKDLINQRLAELKILFKRLERISQSQATVELVIIDHDFRSWFLNPCEYLHENSPLLEDPVPWQVDFDGEEFTLTRTEPVLPEQFAVVY